MELLIKKKVYLKPYQNSFERVNFSVKVEAVGGGRETMADRGWLWLVLVKLWLSWTVVASGGKILVCRAWLWVVVGGAVQIMAGRGWSWVVFQYHLFLWKK